MITATCFKFSNDMTERQPSVMSARHLQVAPLCRMLSVASAESAMLSAYRSGDVRCAQRPSCRGLPATLMRAMLATFAGHRPDLTALADKDTGKYGLRAFGEHYGINLINWVVRNNKETALFAHPPFGRQGVWHLAPETPLNAKEFIGPDVRSGIRGSDDNFRLYWVT